MTTREVILDGGSPWGFRMHGGIDVLQPLRISRVNPGSKAAIKGIREGDIITSINNQSTRDINNTDAHSLLKKSGDILKLGLNEDCSGSPKRRQYNKFLNQEGSTDKIECTSKSNYTSSTLSTINHNQFDLNDLQKRNFTNINGLNETNGAPENGVISQVSTLSSNCSSNSSAGSLIADPQGNRIRQEGRETAALFNVTENSTKLTSTKPVSADNEVNILIANSDMGGNSRSNKKRSRTNRKNSKNSNIVTTSTIVVNEMMVNVPSSSSNSDITEHKNDIKKCESNNSIKSDTDNDEIQTICENKLFECVQTNYRVESPSEVAIKPIAKALNGIVKSRSLDNDDDLKITELSSEASEGEDKTMTECNAVVSETESDVEWEVTEDISNSTENNNNFQSTASIAPENQLETVEVTLITAEEERSLRTFLDGLKLVSSPEEALSQTQTRESYKERKARKRAAIAEHFIPILEQPRYLEVICEENDASDKDHSDSNSSSRTLKNESLSEASTVEGTWKTSLAESSNLKAEIVYIDDSSNSGTESDNSDTEEYEENEDADAEESRSENVSQNSSHQDISKNLIEASSSTSVMDNSSQKILEVAIPSSQLTPPPTPDLLTPKNETVCLENELNETECDKLNTNILQENVQNEIKSALPKENDVSSPYEDEFNKEFHGFCDDLNVQYPCKYLNAVSPLAISRSSSVSSEGSSRTQSQRTVRLNSTCSSIADVADLLKDYEYAKDTHKISTPKTLKEMCLNKVISLPFGSDVLEELADVSKSMENLTVLLESKISPRLSNISHQFSTKKQSTVIKNVNDINFNVPVMKEDIDRESYTKWVSLPSEQDPGVLMCLSPTQKLHLETTKREFDEAGKLLQLHEKFINRRGYNEGTRNNRKMPENVEITVLSNDSEANNASKASKFSNRLLAIIRESSDAQPISYLNVNNDNVIHTREPYLSKSLENLLGSSNMESSLINTTTIDKGDLSEHYENLIKSTHQTKKNNLFNTETSGSYQSEPASYDSRRVQNSSGNTASFANIPNRRFSLPQEFYQRQMHYIREKEIEIRNEIDELEKEKQKMLQEMQEMDEETPLKYFEADKYCISRKGDIAIHNDEIRSQKIESQKQSLTLPAAPTEFFRQQMYDEYMLKIAARQERKSQKVIKITSSPSSQVGESTNSNNMCEVIHISGIEDEFMNKVNERMRKFGLKRDNSDEVKNDDGSADENEEPILVIDGDSLKEVKVLPKHLQEFLDLTRQVADNSNDDIKEEGIWSPGQKSIEDKYRETTKLSEIQKSDDETIIPVWTPRSAGSSPTLERKEFRPVNFESPTLKRKNKPKSEVAETPDSPSAHPPWQVPGSSGKVGVSLSSSLERRLPTSHSAPASGFTEFSASRLPKAQNPTITLLQKAREGQLPRGASYLHTEHSHRTLGDKPPHTGPGEILYQVRREYTSKSDNEIPRRMADLGSRKYEVGIGPTTKDGMPLVLRSEVKDGNQSRWYKRMYETIHKQKPDRDYVTVRYKQRRARYPYLSGYFSEPEQSAFSADYYDSDGAVSDSKYATLDRRRLQESINGKENEYVSCTLPKSVNVTRRQTEDVYRNQPGRIENYIPGHSSISEKEAKEWWDEVMDIFDGWLDDHSALPNYNIFLPKATSKSHLEQQKNIPQPRGHMSKALKESGYESDSTLLFRKREEATQHLSPLEQKEAYKTIQKGGDVPLHGLRKLAPERPKESTDVEYISISPTPIRIRNQYVKPQNQVFCYPLSAPPHPRHVFADYKRTAPTSFPIIPSSFPNPPSPPKRLSSKNSTTLRLISNMKERTEKSPISKRHETCFTSNSKMEKHKVNFLKDKITTKLSSASKKNFESESKLRPRDIKTASVAPSIKSNSFTSKPTPTSKSSNSFRSLSASPSRKITKGSSQTNLRSSTTIVKVKPGTFGTEKRKVDLTLPKLPNRSKSLSKSTELLSPTEVKKAVISQINSLNLGPTYKNSCAMYSSAKNGAKLSKEKILPIQVGFSERGKELLKPTRPYSSLPATPVVNRSTRKFVSSPCPSEKSKSSSQSSLCSKSPLTKNSKPKVLQNEVENKKLRKSRKDQLNGEIARRVKKATVKPMEKPITKSKTATRSTSTQNIKQLNRAELEDSYEQLYHLTQDVIQKQKEAIQSNSFFQHLFLDDIPPPTVSVVHPHSRITEKTRMLQKNATSFSEPSIGALKIYLNHTKPVSDSKFKSLDAAIMRSRSASPKSVTWKIDGYLEEKYRSLSLPPKIIFSETSRPISPTVVRKQSSTKPDGSTKLIFAVSPTVKRKQNPDNATLNSSLRRSGSTSKLIFSETSRPVSPVVTPKIKKSFSYSIPKPAREDIVKNNNPVRKIYFSETSRPTSPVTDRKRKDEKKFCSTEKLAETTYSFSPVLERRVMPIRVERCRSSSPSAKLFFSETSRPVSPVKIEKCRSPSPSTKLFISRHTHSMSPRNRSESPLQKIIFSETSRPVSPVIERKFKVNKVGKEYEYERSYSPSSKLFFSETSRPVSPVIQRKYANEMHDKGIGKVSHLIEISSEVKRPTSPIVHREHCDNLSVSRSPSYRKISQAKSLRYPNELKIFRSRSADAVKDLTSLDDVDSLASVDLSQEQNRSCPYSKSFHSPGRCAKFKELNNFYSTLERMNELERTTSSHELRPRRKTEDEIIDFERWKEVHVRERAEKELEKLYGKLKYAEQEKGFLFQPKDVERYRWKKELDRGLRIKDKSVNNIRESFEKLKDNSYRSEVVNENERIFERDLYKPLWRGNSVVDLASNIVGRRSQSEGRVKSDTKKFQVSEKLLTRGIGSRIWSSLSSEQINLLKGQLAEIYSQNGNAKGSTDYNVSVPIHKKFVPKLSVRRNSEEYYKKPNSRDSTLLTENEKKKLSQDLSREVLNRASKRKNSSVSLVVGKEMRGAVAVADASLKSITPDLESPRTCYSLEVSEDERDKNQRDSDFLLVLTKEDGDAYKNDINKTMQNWAQPKKALVSTDATNRVTSMSETESGSTDESTKTVIHLNKKDDVLKKVEYFEHVAEEQPYTPIIYRASENYSCDAEIEPNAVLDLNATQSEDLNQPRKLILSQSYQDFKELFGEQEQNKFSTPALAATQLASHYLSTTSLKSANGISMKFNEVEHLKNKFENMEDFYSHRLTASPRRCRSNPELTRKEQIIIPGQITGEVDHLRRKYEYPWIFGRGRSRIRRGGVVSPISFPMEDRYMPHINIISKIASLYPKKTVFLSDVRKKSVEELAKILGCPIGEVERIRKKFESPERGVSLLGHMFTSSPSINELRDISPYLTASWTAHKYPNIDDNTRSLSFPDHSPSSWNTELVKKQYPRPKSTSPVRSKIKLSPILKKRDKNGTWKQNSNGCHQHVSRPSFEPVRYKPSWSQTAKPTVTFKEPEPPTPPPKGHHGLEFFGTESPRKYVEKEVTIHYKSPIRQEVKESLSEEELSRRQAEHMKRVYEEERRRKYLQVSDSVNELQDMNNRRHTDNFIPSQKSPIPLNRYDDFPVEDIPSIKSQPRSPDFRLVAKALYNFIGQSARELTFRKGDVIYIRRQVDKNWYEGEHNAAIGLFPANYVEIVPYDGIKSTPRKPHEGQARAKFNFIAQTHLELSLAKGELVAITRRVDDNWFEGRIGTRKGIFPLNYVEVLIDPMAPPPPPSANHKPAASPAAHSILLNGSAGGKESMGSHSYTPIIHQHNFMSSYRAKPSHPAGTNYGSLTKSLNNSKNPINEILHIDTNSESIPYRALYKYRPQNDDELELMEGDLVFVLEKCDDGWYVGSSQRTGAFGTFPGNYVERA